jgi:hypothetical protein
VIELFDGAHEPGVAFLDEVDEVEAAVGLRASDTTRRRFAATNAPLAASDARRLASIAASVLVHAAPPTSRRRASMRTTHFRSSGSCATAPHFASSSRAVELARIAASVRLSAASIRFASAISSAAERSGTFATSRRYRLSVPDA